MQTHFQTSSKKVKIFFEDAVLEVPEGISVAAAVLGSHAGHTRVTEHRKDKRAPYCQMGICFECMMTIDGKANQQACAIYVREGMRVFRQHGFVDVLASEKENSSQERVECS